MSKNTKILLILSIIVFIIAIGIFVFIKIQPNKNTNTIVENKILNQANKIEEPNVFSFTDSEGNELQINEESDLGKAIIFWNSDSEHSLETVDLIDSYYETYKDSIDFYIINTNEKLQNIVDVVNSCNYTFPVYYDNENKASEFYDIDKLPTLIFIDKQDSMHTINDGIDEDTLVANLDLLAENY